MALGSTIGAAALMTFLVSLACIGTAHGKEGHSDSSDAHSVCSALPISSAQPWKLEYSFGGGMMPGTGKVNLLLNSDGSAVVTVTHRHKKPKMKAVRVPAAEMAKVAATLQKWPPSCINTVIRNGYALYDFGQYSLRFENGTSSSTALFDECHVVDNVESFTAIYNAVQALAPYVGKEIKWSSGASIRVKGDMCSPKSEAPNHSFEADGRLPPLNSSVIALRNVSDDQNPSSHRQLRTAAGWPGPCLPTAIQASWRPPLARRHRWLSGPFPRCVSVRNRCFLHLAPQEPFNGPTGATH
jgi:hypothetical protein